MQLQINLFKDEHQIYMVKKKEAVSAFNASEKT